MNVSINFFSYHKNWIIFIVLFEQKYSFKFANTALKIQVCDWYLF